MTEQQPEATPESGQQEESTSQASEQQGKPAEETLGDAGKQALDRMKTERADAQRRAKAAESELEKFRKAAMSDAEKQVAEAETRGRQSATAEFGKRLARTQFDALAGRRNSNFDTNEALEYVDLSKFIGEDGEPDSKAIAAAVERLVPAPQTGPPSFDGGARTTSPTPADMNKRMREALGRSM